VAVTAADVVMAANGAATKRIFAISKGGHSGDRLFCFSDSLSYVS